MLMSLIDFLFPVSDVLSVIIIVVLASVLVAVIRYIKNRWAKAILLIVILGLIISLIPIGVD